MIRTPRRDGLVGAMAREARILRALLLTATPISRGLDNLQALLSLTDYEEVEELQSYSCVGSI
ncbi:MAG: hypothetical protein IPK80_28025 [Nannocystis sp.]|nr:hypothetical protein [Nannocystis sp.]